ncbi:MAG: prepilin-type N-terminal cleavage/methylation domain-containing protein [Halomonas sp.]|nr:GspH/FimT family pseudopilin [Halomonas sp.]TVP47155.1 MAG: prepilin-type N-terminal cleavage/methylation domain-containing protein [Halomonas sp.]
MSNGQNDIPPAFESGFTLFELLITLLLVGMIAAWGLPNFHALGERTVHTSAINRLQNTFSLARNTAISQQGSITLCPAADNRTACVDEWSGELIIVRGDITNEIPEEAILRIVPALPHTQVVYSRGWSYVRYNAMGYTRGFNGSFAICSTNGGLGAQGKRLVLSQLGRLRVDEAPIDC